MTRAMTQGMDARPTSVDQGPEDAMLLQAELRF